jgi:hypothetical protein
VHIRLHRPTAWLWSVDRQQHKQIQGIDYIIQYATLDWCSPCSHIASDYVLILLPTALADAGI